MARRPGRPRPGGLHLNAHPALHLRVTADDGASLVDLRRHIDEVAVPRLVGAVELPALDTDVLLRLTTR
jgi:hypothetical protein